MANLSLTRVNQKLGQAKALLQQPEGASLPEVHQQSLIEAVSFHLVCAYQHYLRELAENYGLKNASGITTAAELAKILEAAGKHPAEAEELCQLRDEQGWLADLHNFYESLWRTPKLAVLQPEGLINLVDIEAHPPVASLKLASYWHGNFVALVRRQRETSAEF